VKMILGALQMVTPTRSVRNWVPQKPKCYKSKVPHHTRMWWGPATSRVHEGHFKNPTSHGKALVWCGHIP